MSVVPQPWPQPAPQYAAEIASMYRGKRARPLPVQVRDKLGAWLADEQFAGAYGVRGKPGWPPSRLALVTIFQKAEDLTGRQAAEYVRTRIDWRYALGLEPGDPGFDHSVLPEFRARVTTDFQARYALRAGVEGTIRQGVAVTGMRRARYRGLDKTRLEHTYAAVALNLIRLDAWWNGHPLDRTRTSHLAAFELQLAS